ncbi:MAG TPA: DUF2779 domain-containing protein [Candidatus Paceibacterota bacterium]
MAQQHLVSKTDYLLYRECPKNTWLKLHKPDVYYRGELSAFELSIIETGNEVEAEARKLFPTGILIEGRDEAARERTADLIAEAQKNDAAASLFQPVFLRDRFLAAVDVLTYDPAKKSWTIYEIKASNAIKEKLHLYDLAFQVALVRKAGLTVGGINLLHLNPDYIRDGALDLIKLFVADDVSEAVNAMLPEVEAEMKEAQDYLFSGTEPSGPCTCIYKGRSAHCTTFSYSNPQVPEYSVHDIARIGVSKAKLTELIDSSIYTLDQIPESMALSEIQANQVSTYISKRPIVRLDKIAGELNSLVYPLYFLDYETFPCAIPRFSGYSPYQQIPFQYSLHVAESADDTDPAHFEFLHEGTDDPGPALAASLMKHIGKIGTVIVWNKKFEQGRNEEIARRLPHTRGFFDDLNGRVYDLMDIFTKQYHVHQDFYGSTSIKYVLPVLVPELSYKNLDIREGGTASQKWNEMTTGKTVEGTLLTSAERAVIATNLKAYCKLDTYAMYAIWKHLIDSL